MAISVVRRQFISALGGAAVAWPLTTRAQQPRRVYRIGVLTTIPAAAVAGSMNAFRDGLRELGYVEGQNLAIDFRSPAVSFAENPEVAADLVRSNVDVILAWTTPSAVAAHRATSTVPIVIIGVSDPVGLGLIASLARPGGNITGLSNIARDLSGKLVELLLEIAPGIHRIGVLRNSHNPSVAGQLRETENAARVLGLEFQVVDASTPEEFEIAFAHLRAIDAKGVVLLADSSLILHAKKIAELAQQASLPTVFQRRENVDAGGLLSYGPNLSEQFRQAATYVDRILKGAKPADLPVIQPTGFDLVINRKTAKALGLTVPQTLLMAADEVID
jgi:putative tryptophan/tyrosine transport system substrate-binding protein